MVDALYTSIYHFCWRLLNGRYITRNMNIYNDMSKGYWSDVMSLLLYTYQLPSRIQLLTYLLTYCLLCCFFYFASGETLMWNRDINAYQHVIFPDFGIGPTILPFPLTKNVRKQKIENRHDYEILLQSSFDRPRL